MSHPAASPMGLRPGAESPRGWKLFRSLQGECRGKQEGGSWHSRGMSYDFGLLALGYQKVLWLHVHCIAHGVYRLGLPEEQEQYLCPVCQQPCKVSVLAEGFTKQALPFAPELIDEPLPRWWLARIGADLEGIEKPTARPRKHYGLHRQKIRHATAAAV